MDNTDKKPFENLEKWAADKPSNLRYVTMALLPNLQTLYGRLLGNRKGQIDETSWIPSHFSTWHRFYFQHKSIGLKSWQLIAGGLFSEQAIAEKMAESDVPDIPTLLEQHLVPGERPDVHLEHAMESNLRNASDEQKQELYFAMVATQFGLHVVLPCWLHYNTSPTRLVRKARQGDRQAMDDLLRLDKSMVADPKIAQHWHRAMNGGDPELRRILLAAVAGQPRTIKFARIKIWAAAAFHLLASMQQYELSCQQLREAFDAAAKDTQGSIIDHDLPDSDEAFYQAVYRERREILKLLGVSADDWQQSFDTAAP